MIKIAVIDDSKYYIDEIKNLLSQCIDRKKYNVCEFLNPENFLEAIAMNKFDIIFLDIVLGDKSGIDIGTFINRIQPEANIIFVSANENYFRDVYRVRHSYFLTKEFEKERFFDAVSMALANLENKYILIKTRDNNYSINLSEVLFIESRLKKTRIVFSNGEDRIYSAISKDIAMNLPKSSFAEVHKSYIVNMRYIESYDSKSVVLSNGVEIPISRSHLKEAREKFNLYLGGLI